MAKKTIVNVDFAKKPGKVEIVIGKKHGVVCRVHYRENLEDAEETGLFIFGLHYVTRIEPVLDDQPCHMCEEEEKIANSK